MAASLTGGLVLGTAGAASASPAQAPNHAPAEVPSHVGENQTTGVAGQAVDALVPASPLAYDSRGRDVRKLQSRLGVDPQSGWFGPLTRAAVTRWQQAHGVPATGVLTPAQYVQLRTQLEYGAHGEAVRKVQNRLGVNQTGWFGPLTRKAVMRWQRAHGVPATGVLTYGEFKVLVKQRVVSNRPTTPDVETPGARPAASTTADRVSAPAPRTGGVSRSASRAGGLNWAALAACESGGNPRAHNAAGYYGLYQFDQRTWQSVGGSGDPRDASAAEQTARAQALYAQRGSSPWPVCGTNLYR